jgi:hypothetical protein
VAAARLKKAVEEAEEAAEEAAEEEVMVFGEGNYVESSGSGDEEDAEAAQTREHKRLKQWGKKNKKLRNKNPYGEDDPVSYVAYSTNRRLDASSIHSLSGDKVLHLHYILIS